MGPEIIIPVVILAIVVPVVLTWARKNLKGGAETLAAETVNASGARFTSEGLRGLPTPPWRTIYEIAGDKLGGVEHVLIGPVGIFALRTSMDPLPTAPPTDPSPNEVAASAVLRTELDTALRRCGLESDRLVTVHWGSGDDGAVAVELFANTTAVNGRRLGDWANTLGAPKLSEAQVDLAWQTVSTAIGRPDPLG